jgi:hypothetical protein
MNLKDYPQMCKSHKVKDSLSEYSMSLMWWPVIRAEAKANLGYIARPYLKKIKIKTKQ